MCSSIFVQCLSQNSHVTCNGLHVSIACELYFVHCTQAILRVLDDSKKHVRNVLCAACKLTAILCQRRTKAYNEMARYKNVIKHVDTKKIVLCQVFTHSPLDDIVSNQMDAKHDTQGLDSTSTNNLTRPVTQCARVLYHKASIRSLT